MTHRLIRVAAIGLAAAFTLAGGTERAAGRTATCTVAPVMSDSAVDQGVGGASPAGYSPNVRGKDTLVRFYLSGPSCSTSQLQLLDASLNVTITNADGTTRTVGPFSPVNPLVADVNGNFPAISTSSTAPIAADTTSDPRFLVPGYNLVSNDSQAFTTRFDLSGHFRVGSTGASTSFGPTNFSTTASFDVKTRALRILVVKMGDPNGIPSGGTCPTGATCTTYPNNADGTQQHPEFGAGDVSAAQNGMSALSRAAPVPGASSATGSPLGDLASTVGGIRYSFNVATSCGTTAITCGMLNLTALTETVGGVTSPLLSPTKHFCLSASNFTSIQPQLTAMLNDWNAANPTATADKVVGVFSSSISNGPANACAAGMAAFGSNQAAVRIDPSANNTGAVLVQEIGHTLFDVPANRSRSTSLYHSKFTEGDQYVNTSGAVVDTNRAYNVASRSYVATDRTAMYASDASWTTDNIIFEAPDYGLLRCQLGGGTTADCATPGTVGTGTGVAAGPHYSIAGNVDATSSTANVVKSFFSQNSVFPTPDPNDPNLAAGVSYHLVQRSGNSIVKNDPVPVQCDTSDHSTAGGAVDHPTCFFQESVDFNTSADQIELWRGTPPATACSAAGSGSCLYVRHTHDQPATTIATGPGPGTIKNYTHSTLVEDGQAALTDDGTAVAWRAPLARDRGISQIRVASRIDKNPDKNPARLPLPPLGYFYFESNRDGNNEIYSMNVDGSNQNRLTNNPGRDIMVTSSPNGQGVAWVRTMPDGTDQIFSLVSGNETQLTTGSVSSDFPTFSYDGTKIYFTRVPADGNRSIWVMDAGTGANQAQVSPTVHGDDFYPAASPDGTQIAFQRFANGNSQIFRMNTDGTGVTQITSGPDSYAQPAWSPVGNRLLFVDVTTGRIILSTTDGTSQTIVTPTAADYRVPRFSPDGTRVLYTIERSGGLNEAIYYSNLDGSGRVQLTDPSGPSDNASATWVYGGSGESQPAWNASGTALAYVIDGNLYKVSVDRTSGFSFGQPVLLDSSGGDSHPTWSGDGTQIAFAEDDFDGGSFLATISAAGGGTAIATGDARQPSWSHTPGDNRIAFVRNVDTCNDGCFTDQILAIDPSGGTPTTLHNGTQPSWGTDGHIAYNSANAIHVMDSAGKNDVAFTNSDPSATEPSLASDGVAFTRDGPLNGDFSQKDIYIQGFAGATVDLSSTTSGYDPNLLSVTLYYHCGNLNYPVSTLSPSQVSGAVAQFHAQIDTSFACQGGNLVMYEDDGFDRWNITPTGGDAIPLSGANQPPVATINVPADGKHFLQFGGIPLQGVAKDPEDGELAGTSLQWNVTDPDGITTTVGSGPSIDLPNAAYPMPAGGWKRGAYTATLTATDSTGLTGVATTHFVVDGDSNNDGIVNGACGDGSPFGDADGDGIPNIDDANPCSPDTKTDTTAPTITATHGAATNGKVTETVTASDNGSGLRSVTCRVDGADVVVPGSAWAKTTFTSSFTIAGSGNHSVDCTALDEQYNKATAHDTVYIAYTFIGFLQPVDNPNTVNTGSAGKTYPVSWQLKDAATGAFVSDLSVVVDANGNPDPNLRYKSVPCGAFSGDPTDSLESQTSGQSVLRYDAGANKYTYNWQTPSTKGCYVLYLLLDDGTTHQADFQLK